MARTAGRRRTAPAPRTVRPPVQRPAPDVRPPGGPESGVSARKALTIALVAAGLAVALVAVDTVYSLEARLETMQDGEWVTVSESPYQDGFRGPAGSFGCAGRDLRVVLDNHRPLAASVKVTVWYYNQSASRDEFVLRETWDLAAFAAREYAFVVPEEAFSSATTDGIKPPDVPSTHVQVQAGDLDPLSVCVNRGE